MMKNTKKKNVTKIKSRKRKAPESSSGIFVKISQNILNKKITDTTLLRFPERYIGVHHIDNIKIYYQFLGKNPHTKKSFNDFMNLVNNIKWNFVKKLRLNYLY